MKCLHCKSVDLREERVKKQGRYIFRCPKCYCVWALTIVRQSEKCCMKREKQKIKFKRKRAKRR